MNLYINNLKKFNEMIKDYQDTLSYFGYKFVLDGNSKAIWIFDNRYPTSQPLISIDFVNDVGKYRFTHLMLIPAYIYNLTKSFVSHMKRFEALNPDTVKNTK